MGYLMKPVMVCHKTREQGLWGDCIALLCRADENTHNSMRHREVVCSLGCRSTNKSMQLDMVDVTMLKSPTTKVRQSIQ